MNLINIANKLLFCILGLVTCIVKDVPTPKKRFLHYEKLPMTHYIFEISKTNQIRYIRLL